MPGRIPFFLSADGGAISERLGLSIPGEFRRHKKDAAPSRAVRLAASCTSKEYLVALFRAERVWNRIGYTSCQRVRSRSAPVASVTGIYMRLCLNFGKCYSVEIVFCIRCFDGRCRVNELAHTKGRLHLFLSCFSSLVLSPHSWHRARGFGCAPPREKVRLHTRLDQSWANVSWSPELNLKK